MQSIIKIRNLSIGYFISNRKLTFFQKNKLKTIHEKINLTAYKGELIALIGSNGAGKSTLLKTLAGLQNSFEGSIFIDKKLINNYSKKELAKKLSFVSTENIDVDNLKVKDLVALGRFPHTNWVGKMTKEDQKKVYQSLDLLGMSAYSERNIKELSDGEKQRVMIARTLAQDTKIILLDEPSAFLDVSNKYEIVNILKQFCEEEEKTIIFSSHDLNIAIKEVDKIWLVLENKIEENAPEDLILNESFNQIFNNSKLFFDQKTGVFLKKQIFNKNINLQGEDNVYKFWTKKALERLNFKVLENSNYDETILIESSQKQIKWVYQNKNFVNYFYSIYDLAFFLKNKITLSK